MAVLAFIQGGVSAQETIIGIPEALISCLTKIFNHRPNIHVILASIPHLFLDDMSSSSDLTKVRACVRACVCASGRPAGPWVYLLFLVSFLCRVVRCSISLML